MFTPNQTDNNDNNYTPGGQYLHSHENKIRTGTKIVKRYFDYLRKFKLQRNVLIISIFAVCKPK